MRVKDAITASDTEAQEMTQWAIEHQKKRMSSVDNVRKHIDFQNKTIPKLREARYQQQMYFGAMEQRNFIDGLHWNPY